MASLPCKCFRLPLSEKRRPTAPFGLTDAERFKCYVAESWWRTIQPSAAINKTWDFNCRLTQCSFFVDGFFLLDRSALLLLLHGPQALVIGS
jgi:hypothetical protein